MSVDTQKAQLQAYAQLGQFSQSQQYLGQYSSGNALGQQIGGGGLYGQQQYQFPFMQPEIKLVPMELPREAQVDFTRGIELLYRFGNQRVQAVLIKGTNNPDTAKAVFLGQFDGQEPEIIAAVDVTI